MSDSLHRWEAHYRARAGGVPTPCQVLADNAHLLPRKGLALDLACGLGGNALFLARRGFDVRAWDIAPTAIAALDARARDEGLAIHAEVVDTGNIDWNARRFDVIVVSRYLDRTLTPALCDSLNPGGLLFYQTFTAAKHSAAGPRNPAYLLGDNEPLRLFAALRVRYYREDAGCGDVSRGLRDEACFVGEKVTGTNA